MSIFLSNQISDLLQFSVTTLATRMCSWNMLRMNAFRDIQDTFSETLGVTADSDYTCTELEQPSITQRNNANRTDDTTPLILPGVCRE